jgi:hypothetical protein
MGPLVALVASTALVFTLLPIAAADRSSASAISPFNVTGWLTGTWVALGLFMWFRTVNDARVSGSSYVIPRWRPRWVVTALVAVSLLGASWHVWELAEAWSRR